MKQLNSNFFEELKKLENTVLALLQKKKEFEEENLKLKEENIKLKKENEILQQTLNQLESKIPNSTLTQISDKDKETLKNKIEELIARIDNHL